MYRAGVIRIFPATPIQQTARDILLVKSKNFFAIFFTLCQSLDEFANSLYNRIKNKQI